MRNVLWLIAASLALSWNTADADQYFHFNRKDQFVPAHCLETRLEHFATNSRYFVYGAEKAQAAGFSYEYPISRADASYLWSVFKEQVPNEAVVREELKGKPHLETAFSVLLDYGIPMGFDYSKEGDVLEVLALVDLRKIYSPAEYFHTGGIIYEDSTGPQLGEIDVLVGRKSDCSVVALGEAKLGLGQLAHAKKQLRRLHDFLTRKICKSDNPPRVCTVNPPK